MLTQNELRIGNYVLYGTNEDDNQNKIIKVESISFEGLNESTNYSEDEGVEVFFDIIGFDDIKGIKLTEFILLQCGFKKEEKAFVHDDLVGIEIYDEDLQFRVLCFDSCISVLNYLHELQNFVFALTKKDLQLN